MSSLIASITKGGISTTDVTVIDWVRVDDYSTFQLFGLLTSGGSGIDCTVKVHESEDGDNVTFTNTVMTLSLPSGTCGNNDLSFLNSSTKFIRIVASMASSPPTGTLECYLVAKLAESQNGFVETLHSTIRTRFKTTVGDLESRLQKIIYDNQNDGNLPDPKKHTMWCRVHILDDENIQKSIGSPNAQRFRRTGVLRIMLFTSFGMGTQNIDEVADKIETAFRAITQNNVRYLTPSTRHIGRDGAWWQVNVDCPYRVDTID